MKAIKNLKKRFLTLIEIMVVLSIIAIVTATLAYRFSGGLDESKAFKTKVAIERVSTILSLKAADDPRFLDNISSEWQAVVSNSPIVSSPKDLLYDGWGQLFNVSHGNNGEIIVQSAKYTEYLRNNAHTMFSNEGHRQ